MNEIQESTGSFDYSNIDGETADYLQERISAMKRHVQRARYDVACELAKAHDKLAKNRYGCFYEWCESIGFNRETVKKELRFYDLIGSAGPNRTIVEALPKRLQDDIARPSAPEELKTAVIAGEITTPKQYHEELAKYKAKLEEWKARAETAEQERDNAISTAESYEADNEVLRQSNKELANRDPVVVEVMPKDYEENKKIVKTLKVSYEEQAKIVTSLKRENAELKAHKNGMTLQEAAKSASDETRAFVKSEIEERQTAEILWKLMDYIAKLPDDDIEMREVARCFLKHNEDMRAYMDGKFQGCIHKLELLSDIFKAKAKLTIVK